MRVLTVSPTVPWPPDHGTRLRGWHLLRRLAATDDVVALTWIGPDDADAALDELRATGADVIAGTLEALDVGVRARLGRRLKAAGGAPPAWIQAMAEERGVGGPAYSTLVDEVVRRHRRARFDVIVLEAEGVTHLPLPLDVPTVVHRHNLFAPVVGDVQRGLGRIAWAVERRVWQRFDRIGADAAAVVATTHESAAVLAPLVAPAPVAVVPNGVDLPAVPLDAGGPAAAFVGAMDYAPNRQAAEWAATRVWPLVRRTCPDAELRLIGKGGGPGLDALVAPNVRVFGYVPELEDALRGCAAGVVPLHSGMGIKNKTLELLAYGLPVVSTTIGAEGIDRHLAGLSVVDEPAAFAAAVTRLLSDPVAAHRLGQEARAAVGSAYSWDAAAAAHRDVLVAAAGRRTSST